MNETDLAPASLSELRAALLDHYDRNRRRLPWRGETDPYRVLVSEVMLQQTRVETVERYYGPWLERFPDLAALARADEGAVLKAWEGLGYYRRALRLHSAARIVREGPGAELPTSYAELRRLPGLGEYTAGAVASIAFGEPVPAVDGNVRRVVARLFDVPDPDRAWLRRTAVRLLDSVRPGDWNQALMELGATVCAPRSPRCGTCPLTPWCRAFAVGSAAARPRRVCRTPPRKATLVLAVLDDGERVLLRRRPAGGLLGGMWALPEREVPEPSVADGSCGDEAEATAVELCIALGAHPLGSPRRRPTCAHRFTHIEATYVPFVLPVARGVVTGDDIAWVEPGEPTHLALPTAQRRILEALVEDRASPTS